MERCAVCGLLSQSTQPRDFGPGDLILACDSCAGKIGLPCSALTAHDYRQPAVILAPELAATVVQYLQEMLDEQVCPVCHQPLTAKRQVGRSVVAEPCGHRIYQGKAQLHIEKESAADETYPT